MKRVSLLVNRTLLLTLAALLYMVVSPLSLTALAQGSNFTPDCDGTDDTAKFTALVSSIGPNTGTIRLPYKAGSRCAVNNLTIPANITLDNSDGTGVKVNTGQTLTILGPLVNPTGKRFFYNALNGQGTVSLVGSTKVKAVHVGWWGAVADSSTDNTTSIQAALTSAGTAKGIIVEFDNTAGGYYSFGGQLSLTGLAQITLRGAGSGRQGGGAAGNIPNSARTELRYTGKGTASAIVGAPVRAVTFEGLAIRYSSPAFTGDLISFDNPGTTGNISAQNRIQECLLGGASVTAVNARSLVLFRNNVEGGVRDSVLTNAVRGIIGRGTLADGTSGAGTAFSNAILIHNTRFQFLSGYAIVNPGAQWEITGNVFEPGRDNKGRAITTEDAEVNGRYANTLEHKGVTITGNGFWDATAGGTWIIIRGSGYYIAGNFVTLYNNGAKVDGKFIKLYGDATKGTHGVVVMGNAFAGGITGGAGAIADLYVDQSAATAVSNVVLEGNGGVRGPVPPAPNVRSGPGSFSHPATSTVVFTTSVLDFGAIAASTTTELTIMVAGAAPGMSVQVTPEGAPETGLMWSGYVSATGTVSVRLGNMTTAAIDPAPRAWRATVTK